jgi:peptidoglycan/LPS O-acetylase OafA/YrhL
MADAAASRFVDPSRAGDAGQAKRIPSLDGLRALSILLVLVGHLGYAEGFHSWWTDAYAHAGVRVFFVVSGYLITTLLLREREATGAISVGQFYLRRAWRILPVAYAYLTVVTISDHSHLSWRDLALSWGYLASYAFAFGTLPWNLFHLWSLSVEEQFYLVWPLITARRLRWAKRVAWAAVLLAPICRYWFDRRKLHLMTLFSFPSVVDSLAIGCLIALGAVPLIRRVASARWGGLVWLVALLIPQATQVIGEHHRLFPLTQLYYTGWTLFNVCVGAGILWAIAAQPKALNHWIPVWVGTLSYGLYIWQMPFMNPEAHLGFPLNLMLAFAAASASYYLLEQPLLRVRDRLEQSEPEAMRKAA